MSWAQLMDRRDHHLSGRIVVWDLYDVRMHSSTADCEADQRHRRQYRTGLTDCGPEDGLMWTVY
jgi:hypothetical protein